MPKQNIGDIINNSIATVAIPGLPQPLSYLIPPDLYYMVGIGSQVQINLGNRRAIGWVIAKSESDDLSSQQFQLKPILSSVPAFPESLLGLFSWFSGYYCCSLAEAIANAIPSSVSKSTKTEDASAIFYSPDLHPPALTDSQSAAIDELAGAMETASFVPHLLFGVTGSGKTEVYINCINKAIELGKTALVIVPEISLTPQLFRNFSERINDPIAILHSQLAKGERWRAWQSLLRGDIKVAIGARSAIFAPLNNLGVIIVDEEHDASYKQSDGLRYSARDTAIMRAKLNSCPIILGSATPSFESLMNTKRGKYRLIEMPSRVTNRPLPQIEIVNLAKIRRKEMLSKNVSPQLFSALKETFDEGEQAVVLYNKRGFSSFLQCTTCGDVLKCPHCAVSLTYHKNNNLMICHYCDYRSQPLQYCPICRDPRLSSLSDPDGDTKIGEIVHCGAGTERIEEELLELFPDIRIARMDRDTVSQRNAHSRILDAMRSGNADLLLGTQMIAKGHDLPRVTLVGVIDADVGLHFPDFRANERVFQLITQAAGRAGRANLPGRVIVQTREANHPTMVALATGRFKAFVRYELEFRETLNYPPFTRMMRIVISSPHEELAAKTAKELTVSLQKHLEQLKELDDSPSNKLGEILGPTIAPLERIRGRFRHHLIIKSSSSKLLSLLGQHTLTLRKLIRKKDDIRITVDMDPLDML